MNQDAADKAKQAKQAEEADGASAGHKLLHAVERMTDSNEAILKIVAKYRGETSTLAALCTRIVSHYSNRSALAGGTAALPGILPGIGTLVVAVGTTLAEMAFVLKLEVEMCLALASAHGFDIREPRERQLAMLLAAVQTHEVASGRNILLDVGEVSAAAVFNYTPRELEKLLLNVFGLIALRAASRQVGKGLMRALPFVGIAVGAGVNKFLTARVGKSATVWLAGRVRDNG